MLPFPTKSEEACECVWAVGNIIKIYVQNQLSWRSIRDK